MSGSHGSAEATGSCCWVTQSETLKETGEPSENPADTGRNCWVFAMFPQCLPDLQDPKSRRKELKNNTPKQMQRSEDFWPLH